MRRRHQPTSLKDIDWYKYIRRYFWDDETTPYLIPVAKLHRRQADHELFAYCIFLIFLFAIVTLASITGKAPYGRSFGASMFGFVIACSALILGTTREFLAAVVCAAAPLGALVYGLSFHLQPDLSWMDRGLLIGFSVLWLRYALRVISIARSYQNLGDPPTRP